MSALPEVLYGRNSAHRTDDGLANVRLVLDSSGSIVASTVFGEFGIPEDVSGSAGLRPHGYTGGLGVRNDWDSSGLHYMRQRYYDPQLGRWLSADPIGFSGGLNLYTYVKNSPISGSDPSGLLFEFLVGGQWQSFSNADSVVAFLRESDNRNIQGGRFVGHGNFVENARDPRFSEYQYTFSANDPQGDNGYLRLTATGDRVTVVGLGGKNAKGWDRDFSKLLNKRLAKGAQLYFGGCSPGSQRKGFKSNLLKAVSAGAPNHLVYGSAQETANVHVDFGIAGSYQSEDPIWVPGGNELYFNGNWIGWDSGRGF